MRIGGTYRVTWRVRPNDYTLGIVASLTSAQKATLTLSADYVMGGYHCKGKIKVVGIPRKI
jgi:hypothetical protein